MIHKNYNILEMTFFAFFGRYDGLQFMGNKKSTSTTKIQIFIF